MLRRVLRPDVWKQLLYFPTRMDRELCKLVSQSDELENRLADCREKPHSGNRDCDLNFFCWNCQQFGYLWEDYSKDSELLDNGYGFANVLMPLCPKC